MTNAEKFQKVFGYYATEMWAKPEKEFLEWINAEALEQEETLQNLTKPNKSDLISRQAAIDAVHKEFDECLVWDESGKYTADEVERILTDVPSAQPFTTEQIQTMQELKFAQVEKAYELGKADRPKWIPCSERLPEEEGKYFVTCFNISNRTYVDLARWVDNLHKVDEFDFPFDGKEGFYKYDAEYGYYDLDNVIAWMELPEAYREDGEEE